MKQPKNSVITGLKALYLQGIISFNPSYTQLVFKNGTNLKYYNEKLENIKTSTSLGEYLLMHTVDIDGSIVYSKERLFVELDTFSIDPTLRKEALKNLIASCDASKVAKILKDFEKRNRFNPSKESIEFVKSNKINFSEMITTIDNFEQILREYIMNRLFENNIDIIYKGGALVETLGQIKRSTLDIDAYVDISEHQNIINALSSEKDNLRFIVKDFNKKDFKTIEQFKHARIEITPIFKSSVISAKNPIKSLVMDLDYSLHTSDINEFKNQFKLKPTKLWKTNRKIIGLSREMLIAEKIQSALDSQNKNTWRSKDFIDIFILFNKNLDISKIITWFSFKVRNSEYSLDDYKSFFNKLNTKENDADINASIETYDVKDFNKQVVLDLIKEVLEQ